MSRSTSSKQRTLDFYFSPKPSRDDASPNMKHFGSNREASPESSRFSLTVERNWMDLDFEESDEEPIAKFKNRKKRPWSREQTPPTTTKKFKKEEIGGTRSDAAESIFEEKLEGWNASLTERLDSTTESESLHDLSTAKSADVGSRVRVEESRSKRNEKFSFLRPDNIRDGRRRRPSDPDYDPSTLFIPTMWFDQNNISPAQRQWWTFKASNFDALLLFKIGKFYELYEMDAHAAVDALGLKYMKGDRPHCGFPEAAYSQMAGALAAKGYRVAVIEQTETPEQLKLRNQELKRLGQSTDKVVRREQVAVITKGTTMETEMMGHENAVNYLMSVYMEKKDGSYMTGMCAVDVASSQFLMGAFVDDDLFTKLRTQIAMLNPVEFLLPSGGHPSSAELNTAIEQACPTARINLLSIDEAGFPSVATVRSMLDSYFSSKDRPPLPTALREILASDEDHAMMLRACGGVINFLKKGLLDEAVIPVSSFNISTVSTKLLQVSDFVSLDSSAIENLEIFTDSDNKTSGSLFASVDHCCTPFGRRLLKQWIAHPLTDISTIVDRQQAIHDLLTVGAEAAGKLRRRLTTVGDLERQLVRLHADSLEGSKAGRYADHVVLYEDAVKKKVSTFVSALDGLQAVNEAVQVFEGVASRLTSSMLRKLVTKGEGFPDVDVPLTALISAADWKEAKKTGRVVPNQGSVFAYDAAERNVQEADRELDLYIDAVRSSLNANAAWHVSRFLTKRERCLIEVSDRFASVVPDDFDLVSQRKGFKRFTSPRLKQLIQSLESAEENREEQLTHVLHDLLKQFLSNSHRWTAAVRAIAQLDCLLSLTIAAVVMEGPSCRPEFLPFTETASPVFKAKGLRHPLLRIKGRLVPNDIELGGDKPNFMVLTGANMGGKSTCLRQVCLAALMAQIGAWVPAESLHLTPVDAIFVRMGASDRIVCGQSTFFVELFETASMLKNASKRSMVALDELGRGTATKDGEAIAHAVLHRLSNEIQCRGLFATHYHGLAKEFASNEHVAVKHMACEVATDREMPDVRFLYKVVEGVAPKSYGMHVARLAGLPREIVKMADEVSTRMEAMGLKKT